MSEDFLSIPTTVLWQRALQYYAAHDWFMVHEALEVLWNRSGSQDAELYQGFLQASVSLYHYGNANFSGARKLATLAITRLSALPPDYRGVDIKGFIIEFEILMLPVMNNTPGLKPLNAANAPIIRTT
jgi:predicted metal-dependent hydrolase